MGNWEIGKMGRRDAPPGAAPYPATELLLLSSQIKTLPDLTSERSVGSRRE